MTTNLPCRPLVGEESLIQLRFNKKPRLVRFFLFVSNVRFWL